MNYLELLRLAAPEAAVVATALVILAIGLARDRRRGIASAVAAFGVALAIAATFTLPPHADLYAGMLVITPLTKLLKVICLALAFFTVLLARDEESALRNHAEYLAMILFATVGLMLLVGSEELLMIFIGLELTGLSLYILAAFDRTNVRSAEAGLKYFLFGSTASAFTLFGLSFVYGTCGTTSLAAMSEKLAGQPTQPLLAAGIAMALAGFAFKVAAAPFHLWAPDVYQTAPIPSAAFIASGSKVASFSVLGKVLLLGLGPAHGSAAWHAMIAGWMPLVAALAALSIVIGNLAALAQTNVRRLLAYSAVAHAGYTLLGLVAGGREGFSATLFYTVTYAFTLVGVFGVVALVRRETGGDDLTHFAELRSRSPFLAGCMAIFILSLAGLPPLAGFFGKFYLFSVALRSSPSSGLLWLIALALVGSLVSLYYYLVILKVIFGGPGGAKPEQLSPITLGFLQLTTLTMLAGTVVFLGVLPGTLVAWIIASMS